MRIKTISKLAALIAFAATVPTVVLGQRMVRGKISGADGKPAAGVVVGLSGSSRSAISGADGSYAIDTPDAQGTLTFQLLGHKTASVAIGGQSDLNVTLAADATSIDEVVVVGYGVQKKINLSGAVQAVSGADALADRPINNVATGLQGMVPNLNVTVGSGRANDAPIINVRGFTSINDVDSDESRSKDKNLGNGSAFVLVDNVPVSAMELGRINPADIESVSVLKDAAAAAIYGARAAFGVVLITTKSAKSGKLSINFSGNYAVRTRGTGPEYVTDPETVMNMKAQARYPLSELYTPQQLDYAKQITAKPSIDRVIINPADPTKWQYYGQTDWYAETHKNSASSYTANLNISQKTDRISYYVSGGYFREEGMLKYGNDILQRYNIRSRNDMNLARWWKVGTNLSYSNTAYDSPTMLDGNFYWQVNRVSSLDVPRNPDGSYTKAGAEMIGVMKEGGRRVERTNETQVSINSKWNLIGEVWTINADANFRRTARNRDQNNMSVPYRSGPNQPLLPSYGERGGEDQNSVDNVIFQNWDNRYDVYNVYTNFTKTFADKHYVNVMAGYNRETSKFYHNKTFKTMPITSSLPEINLSTGETTATNKRSELALEGIFARANYIYDNRYIVEVNGRYDGSSRFPRKGRYGVFPSASVAWALSNEHFFEGVAEKLRITNLKFRGSYGELGNQTLDSYYPSIPYMEVSNTKYILDGTQPVDINQPKVVSPSLTWETVRTANFGVDLSLWNRFDASFDFYNRYTEDMLTQAKELPAAFGATPPKENAADLKTQGWELSLGYRDRFTAAGSPFNYSVKFMISDSRTHITRYDNQAMHFGRESQNFYVGKEIGEIWGFTSDGVFQNQAELDALDQRAIGSDDVGYIFKVGDIKMVDRNGDGKISFGDNTLANPGDRTIIGNSAIHFPYSFELAADWKGVDIRAFFQGVGKRDWYPPNGSIYFWGIYAQPWTNVTTKNMDHWTETNPNGYFPRVKAYAAEDAGTELSTPQTKYLQDASYLRMKNLTVGYTLPQQIVKRAGIANLRLYFSAENVFTISKLLRDFNIDPEMINSKGGGGAYPMQRRFSFGVDMSF